jgi:hypothetical protein
MKNFIEMIREQMPQTFGEWVIASILFVMMAGAFTVFMAFMKFFWSYIIG